MTDSLSILCAWKVTFSIVPVVAGASASALMLTGRFINRRASETMSAGMVAENNIVWCGVASRIFKSFSMSGRKPRSSISSASSRTSAAICERSR